LRGGEGFVFGRSNASVSRPQGQSLPGDRAAAMEDGSGPSVPGRQIMVDLETLHMEVVAHRCSFRLVVGGGRCSHHRF